MKVVIFGAAGGIGKHAVQHALNKGYEVNAFARNPNSLSISHKNWIGYNKLDRIFKVI